MNLNLGEYILKICQTGMLGRTGESAFFIINDLYYPYNENIQKLVSGQIKYKLKENNPA